MIVELQPDPQEVTCPQYTGQRFRMGYGANALTVPGLLEDRCLRDFVRQGLKLDAAYGACRLSDIYPPAAMAPCIKTVLRSSAVPGAQTCQGFLKCWQEYMAMLMPGEEQKPSADVRMPVTGTSYVAPSWNEEQAIRFYLLDQRLPLAQAYQKAGAGDIYPAPLADCIQRQIKGGFRIYEGIEICAEVWRATVITTPTVTPTDTLNAKADEEEKTKGWVYGIVAGVCFLAIAYLPGGK